MGNKSKIKKVFLILILFYGLLSFAGGENVYNAYLLKDEPVLDGKIDEDPAWKNIISTGEFSILGSKMSASKPTSFRIGYTPDALYLAIECAEPAKAKIKAQLNDKGTLWEEDSVEIFFQIPETKGYYHFIVNAVGSKYSSSISSPSSEKTPISPDLWMAKTYINEKSWCIEIKIPFEILKTMPDEQAGWKFNMCRNICSMDARQYTTWSSLLANGFHEPNNFGGIAFHDTMPPEIKEITGKKIVSSLTLQQSEVFLCAKPSLGIYLKKGVDNKRISFSQASYVSPRISPDGTKILYHSRLGGNDGKLGVWLMECDGNNVKRICDGQYAEWAPSGEKIVFQRDGRIMERELETGREQFISPDEWIACGFPSYLSGKEIIFASERNGKWGIYVVDDVKKDVPKLLLKTTEKIVCTPKGSPDGKQIAYQDSGKIYLFNIETKESVRLTTAPGIQSWPVWSGDGKSICFLQSPETSASSCDLYYLRLGEPQKTGLVDKDIYPAFDWKGIAPSIIRWTELKGKAPDVRQREKEIEIVNDWLVLKISLNANSIFLLDQNGGGKTELLFLDKKNNKINAVKVGSIKKDKKYAELQVLFTSGGEATFRLPSHSPFIEVREVKKISKLSLKKNFTAAVLPDRLANDITFTPSSSKPSVAFPETPLIVGIPETKEDGLFLLINPSEKQKVQLVNAKEKNVFSGMDVYPSSDESIFISLLCGKKNCYQQTLNAATAEDVRFDWVQPFQATWRVALSGEAARFSVMRQGEELVALKEKYMTIKTVASERFNSGLVYLYGRNRHTPLAVFTPADVLLDIPGTEKLNELLDLKGIRGYRVSKERVPLKMYLGLLEQNQDIYEKGGKTKMVFAGISVGTEGSYKLVEDLHNDIINILKGLDGRIVEYQNFVHSLKGNAAIQNEKMEKLEVLVAALSITKTEDIILSNQTVRSIKGYLNNNKDFGKFLELSRKAAMERKKVLSLYREFIKDLREYAELKTAEASKQKPVYEELRRQTGKMLLNRYYLEGDWRGEDTMEDVQ